MSVGWLGDYAQYLDYLNYSPTDMVQFSARTYHRLFQLYNRDLWPAPIAALVLAALLPVLAFGARPRGRIVAVLLATAWLFVACAFLYQRYATIHLGGQVMAAGFALQALLLFWHAARDRMVFAPLASGRGLIGVALYGVSVVLLPLIGPLLGRDWDMIELFALAPDPTALATLGLVLALKDKPRWPLFALPLAWVVVSAATLLALQATEAFVQPALALIALALARACPDPVTKGKSPNGASLG